MSEARPDVGGRPRSPNRKQLVSLRISPDVLAHFRSTGGGWQTRIDAALRAAIALSAGEPSRDALIAAVRGERAPEP